MTNEQIVALDKEAFNHFAYSLPRPRHYSPELMNVGDEIVRREYYDNQGCFVEVCRSKSGALYMGAFPPF